MAVTLLSNSARAAGNKISSLFHSIFFFSLGACRQAFHTFSISPQENNLPSAARQTINKFHTADMDHSHSLAIARDPTSSPPSKDVPSKLTPTPQIYSASNNKDGMVSIYPAPDQVGLGTTVGSAMSDHSNPENIDKESCQPYPAKLEMLRIKDTEPGDLQVLDGKGGPGKPDSYKVSDDEAENIRPGSFREFDGLLETAPSEAQRKFSFSTNTEDQDKIHGGFMEKALDMARLALKTNETPVGCVLVHDGRVVAKGMNATNVTRNGTRHAELMAISALISHPPSSSLGIENSARRGNEITAAKPSCENLSHLGEASWTEAEWDGVDPTGGHLYPYGQKLHPSPRVSQSIISECVLYVTVEPCVMCASLLRQLRIRKVYFGAVNDKFGGTGGVFSIHVNSTQQNITPGHISPILRGGSKISGHSLALQASTLLNAGAEPELTSYDCSTRENLAEKATSTQARAVVSQNGKDGDGGIIEPGYEVEGGWARDAAVTLLRQFYVQENGRAPAPRKKEGRAARLAAMMERDGHAGGPMSEAPIIHQTESSKNYLLADSPPEASDDPGAHQQRCSPGSEGTN